MLELQVGNQFFFEKAALKNEELFSESTAMQALKHEMEWINQTGSPVLILGKPGSGKELIARELFRNHSNQTHSFLKVDINSLNREEVSENLFDGYEHPVKGFLSKFTGNTLCVKGLENLDFSLQLKILRVLKSPELKALQESLKIRLLFTAHSDLLEKVKEGWFHEELFSYFSRHLLFVPELRERRGDIQKLFYYYLSQSGFKGAVEGKVFDVLRNYAWRRNVTELKELCLRLSSLCTGEESIVVSHLPLSIREARELPLTIKYNPKVKLEKIKNWYIKLAVDHFQCKKKAARALGISVKTIYNKEMEGFLF